jgi:hypothetical protein
MSCPIRCCIAPVVAARSRTTPTRPETAARLLHHHGKSGRQLADWLGHQDPAFTVATYVGQVDEGLGDAGFLDELIPPGHNRRATPVQRGEAQRL